MVKRGDGKACPLTFFMALGFSLGMAIHELYDFRKES